MAIDTIRKTENTRRWRARHPERVKEIRQKQYTNRKRRTLEMLGGAICVECGCDELSFLEINHIGGGGSMEWKSNKGSLMDLILSGRRSVDGLNVLCRVCNAVEFLTRKNKSPGGGFVVHWEKFTGKRAERIG